MEFEAISSVTQVELKAVISAARVTSGALARFAAGALIEIGPVSDSLLNVTFEVAGRRLARAVLRNEGGRLIATIVELCREGDERDVDEWRVLSAVAP